MPTSSLDGIIAQGFVPIESFESRGLPEDWELYGKGEQRIIYDGREDRVVDKYSINPSHSPSVN